MIAKGPVRHGRKVLIHGREVDTMENSRFHNSRAETALMDKVFGNALTGNQFANLREQPDTGAVGDTLAVGRVFKNRRNPVDPGLIEEQERRAQQFVTQLNL